MGAGTVVSANLEPYQNLGIKTGYLEFPISAEQMITNIFGTDKTWYQIDTTNPFYIQIDSEVIEVNPENYNWLNNSVEISFSARGAKGTTATIHNPSSGANGTIDIANYFGAPGWSQILDINRCPDYALPWLAQFVGATVSKNSNFSRRQIIQKITQRAGFNRGTSSSMVDELVELINYSFPTAPVSNGQIILLENCKPGTSMGQYSYDQYAITILVPYQYFTVYTYASFAFALQNYFDSTGATQATYDSGVTNLQTFIGSGNTYGTFFAGSDLPSNASNYVNYIYRYRPAGVEIFIGGY
jgi:hypothetical protein